MDLFVAMHLLVVTALDGQHIAVNPDEIVSLRSPHQKESLGHPNVNCIIATSDGKFISVTETCETVRQKLEGGP